MANHDVLHVCDHLLDMDFKDKSLDKVIPQLKALRAKLAQMIGSTQPSENDSRMNTKIRESLVRLDQTLMQLEKYG